MFKKLLPIFLLLICLTALCACETSISDSSTDKELPETSVELHETPLDKLGHTASPTPLSFQTLEVNGCTARGEVPFETTTFSFQEEIQSLDTQELTVRYEKPDGEILSLSNVGLKPGMNRFYLSSSEGNGATQAYLVEIYRQKQISVEFRNGDAVFARLNIMEGNTIQPPDGTPIRMGHLFAGWDYAFIGEPVYSNSDTIVIRARWQSLSDIFELQADETSCLITGVKDPSLTACTIPEYVTGIAPFAFADCTELRSVEIPATVRSIGAGAFSGCTGLEEVSFPILDSTPFAHYFPDSDSIRTVTLTAGDELPKYAFYSFDGLQSVTLPEGMTRIGASAFENCSELSFVALGEDIQILEQYAFAGCESLEDLRLPESVCTIEAHAFSRCSSLVGIRIPDAVETIPAFAFSGCSRLRSVELSSNLRMIGQFAFAECSDLRSVSIPVSLQMVESSAFRQCTGLERVDISDIGAWCSISFDEDSNPLKLARNLYLNGELVEHVQLPDGLRAVGDFAFEGALHIRSVFIPASVKEIGEEAFRDCDDLLGIGYESGREDWLKIKFGWMWLAEYQDDVLLFFYRR